LLLAALLLTFSGCATPYQRLSAFTLSGGYDDKDMGKNVYRVCFGGNGYITRETAQCYFLYRCSEIALEKGYDGFEFISDIRLADVQDPARAFGVEEKPFRSVQYVPIIIPMDNIDKPYFEADILLLKAPISENPPHVFDARKLKAALEPYVTPAKGGGNVTPHIHEYLLPEGKIKDTSI
jgi:hypothetical protein